MKWLLLIVLAAVGCGDVQGMPFGGTLPGSGGTSVLVRGVGGSSGAGGAAIGATEPSSTGGVAGAAPAAGGAGGVDVEGLPACPDYVTAYGSPITTSAVCGVSADGRLLFGCVGVEHTGYPLDTTPCQFTDPNNAYNDSHVFGCVDARNCP